MSDSLVFLDRIAFFLFLSKNTSDCTQNLYFLRCFLRGWALHSFPFGMFRSFPFFKRNVLFFSVLFLSFWRLMRPKRTFRSFLKNGKERKEHNVLLQRTEKNARTFLSFAKERENVPFFFQYIYIYKYIDI